MADDLTSSGSRSFDPADRRDSPRVPMKFHVRDATDAGGAAGGDFQEVEGDLSVGGALFHAKTFFDGKLVDVRFHLPEVAHDVICKADVLRVRDEPGGKRVHLKFTEMPIESELAIAKYIDDLIASLGS